MKPKSLITLGLIAFVAVSIFAVIAKEFGGNSTATESGTNKTENTLEDRVVAYYFHGTVRCVTCRNIESYARQAVETFFADELASGHLEFQVVNVETPDTQHFIRDYQLVSPSVVLVRFESGTQATWKNLSDVWRLAHNEPAFFAYIQDETSAMIRDGS